MRCTKAREYLSRHLDDNLPPRETGELDRHLDDCAECRTYRSDLRIGQRLLAATEPELPENFDWKLQLQLNRTLREAAGEAVLPWHEDHSVDRWSFLKSFGTATAAGLAAVLTLAMFLGPQLMPRGAAVPVAGTGPAANEAMVAGWDASDRLPLYSRGSGGSIFRDGSGLQAVSGQSRSTPWQRPETVSGWSGHRQYDLQTIQRLRYENRRLQNILGQYQHRVRALQTYLDTTGTGQLDLRNDPRSDPGSGPTDQNEQ